MNKYIAILMVTFMFTGTVYAESINLTGYTDQELDALSVAIVTEKDRRKNEGIPMGEDEESENFSPIQLWSRGEQVVELQEKLNELGFSVGNVDGIFGEKSTSALKDLQKILELEETGVVNTREELDGILSINVGDGINLAARTKESVLNIPFEGSSWCIPTELYPTTENGMAQLADINNTYFTVSFDWQATGVDAAIEAGIALRYTDSEKTWYGTVGDFSIPVGESNGHCIARFIPTEEMREYGTGWLITGIGEKNVNRGLQLDISKFKFETGIKETEWEIAPEDE